MGGQVASQVQWLLLVVLTLCLPLISADLVPYTLTRTTAEIEPRGLYEDGSRLQPRHEIRLHYADGASTHAFGGRHHACRAEHKRNNDQLKKYG